MFRNQAVWLTLLALPLSACGSQTPSAQPPPGPGPIQTPVTIEPVITYDPITRFSQIQQYNTGIEQPYFATLLAGDLDGDGNLDLLITADRSFLQYRGNGNGTFTRVSKTSIPFIDFDFPALSDLNGDGRLDLVIGGHDSTKQGVGIYLNQGGFVFKPTATLTVGDPETRAPRIEDLKIADFNHDGSQDIVTANFDNRSISLFLGAGDGTFADQKLTRTPFDAARVTVSDLNGDGLLDLILTDSRSTPLTLLLNPDNTFTYLSQIDRILGNIYSYQSGDVNGDGIPDFLSLVLADDYSSDPTIFGVYLNTYLGDGTGKLKFTSSQRISKDASSDKRLIPLDPSGTTLSSVVISDSFRKTQAVYERQADGTYLQGLDIPLNVGSANAVFRDFNHDGKVDFASLFENSLYVRLQ